MQGLEGVQSLLGEARYTITFPCENEGSGKPLGERGPHRQGVQSTRGQLVLIPKSNPLTAGKKNAVALYEQTRRTC